jgi:hypothetical protein
MSECRNVSDIKGLGQFDRRAGGYSKCCVSPAHRPLGDPNFANNANFVGTLTQHEKESLENAPHIR